MSVVDRVALFFSLRRRSESGAALALTQGSRVIDSDRIERNLSILYTRATPDAIRVYAQVLAAMHEELAGSRATEGLANGEAPSHWREKFRGERSASMLDFCRLATEQTKEARLAVRAALAVLAAEINSRPFPASERAAVIALDDDVSSLSRVLMREGLLDENSRALLLPLALRAQQDAADLIAALQGGMRK